MANQSRPRPWSRLGSLASLSRPVQPQAPRPQMQPAAGILPRPTRSRPTFRLPAADAAPQLQAPAPRAPPPVLPFIPPITVAPRLPSNATTPPVAQKSPLASPVSQKSAPLSPASPKTPLASSATQKSPLASPVSQKSAPVSPASPKTPLVSSATQKSPFASPVTQKSPHASPVTQKSPLASPVSQKTPVLSPVSQKSPLASPVTQKSPLASPVSQKTPLLSSVTKNSPLASPVTQLSPLASPITRKSPLLSPVSQKSPLASPITQKSPSAPKASPISSQIPSRPPSPKPITQSSPPSKPASPYSKQIVSPKLPSSPRAANPLPETPPESPKIKSALHSRPLLSLPPSQFESDGEYEKHIIPLPKQKTMLPVQHKTPKPYAFEDTGARLITISGENKGAIMELGYSSRTRGNKPYNLRHDGELSDGNKSDNEGKNHTAKAEVSTPMHAFMNSNVQGINSSIVLNSTLSHHDPGVHLSFAKTPTKARFKEDAYRFSDY